LSQYGFFSSIRRIFHSPVPLLDSLLAQDGFFHRRVQFIPDQLAYAVFTRESLYDMVLMLPTRATKLLVTLM